MSAKNVGIFLSALLALPLTANAIPSWQWQFDQQQYLINIDREPAGSYGYGIITGTVMNSSQSNENIHVLGLNFADNTMGTFGILTEPGFRGPITPYGFQNFLTLGPGESASVNLMFFYPVFQFDRPTLGMRYDVTPHVHVKYGQNCSQFWSETCFEINQAPINSLAVIAVPEPESWAMLMIGITGLLALARKKAINK